MTTAFAILALLTTLQDVATALGGAQEGELPFDVRGLVTLARTNTPDFLVYVLADGDQRLGLSCAKRQFVPTGAVVRVRGFVGREHNGWRLAYANRITVVGHAPVPPPVTMTSRELDEARFRGQTVRLTALVLDCARDEIDPRYEHLVLRDTDGVFHASLQRQAGSTNDALVGATLELVGTPAFPVGGKRKFFTSELFTDQSGLTVIAPAPDDPFDVPDITTIRGASSARTITAFGRRRADGRVLATWGERHILLRTDAGQVVRADLAHKERLPTCGTRIAAVGFPGTDLFNLSLARALFRTTDAARLPPDAPTPVSAADILSGIRGKDQIQPDWHGRRIRLRGQVVTQPAVDLLTGTMELASDGYRLDVNVENGLERARRTEVGSTVEITGVCVLNTRNWSPENIFPRIDGVTVVLQSPDDFTVLARPPWWTVKRLLGVMGTLVAALLAIFAWNRILNSIIRRRSDALMRTELAKAKSDLRIGERTRLAVDIHDSLSQTLTGVSFHIAAAEKTVGSDDASARGFLAVAKRTLASCREELRRCLWDLRNNAIDETSLSKALARVLRPYASAAEIRVDVDVPRRKLTDSAAHDVLSIVRELTVNAIRHGHAAHIRITGERHGKRIRLSVADDGGGFDPATRPGVDEGHFGLQGVRERLNRLGGTLRIESAPGKGTEVIVEFEK